MNLVLKTEQNEVDRRLIGVDNLCLWLFVIDLQRDLIKSSASCYQEGRNTLLSRHYNKVEIAFSVMVQQPKWHKDCFI